MAPRAFLPRPDAVGEAITHALGLLWDKERGAPYKMIPAKPPWREKTEIIVEGVSQADLAHGSKHFHDLETRVRRLEYNQARHGALWAVAAAAAGTLGGWALSHLGLKGGG